MTAPTDNAALRAALEPCPFCGSTANPETFKDNRKLWTVRCGCGLHGTWNTRRYGAVEDWNERAVRHRRAALAAAIPPEQDGYAEGRALLAEQAHEWRRREVQAIGAAISNRSWPGVELAYNVLRDKMDRAGCWNPPSPQAVTPTDRHAEGRIAGLEEALQPLADVYITGAEDDDEDALDVDFPKVSHVRAARKALRTIANGGTAA